MRETARGHLLVLLSFVLLSAVWSWPMAKLFDPVLPTRHFDLLPTVWVVDVGPAVYPDLTYADSRWPESEQLFRLDSYVLLALSWLNQNLLSGPVFLRLLMWLGPAVSAFAAERCAARAFKIERPWSWFAGVSYGFSGVMASAALEGQAYSLFNPWLPLLLWACWLGCQPGGRWWHGLAAGAAWGLGHLTSAYFGFLGLGVIAVCVVRALLWIQRPKLVLRFGVGLAATALPAGLLQIALFSQGTSDSGISPGIGELLRGSMTMAELLGWADSIDIAYHSVSAPLHWGAFWLMMLAPVLLPGGKPWRVLMAVSLAAVLFSLGPLIQVHHASPAVPSPFRPLLLIPGVAYFRFPYRFMWLYSLFSGVAAAMVLQELSRRLSRRWMALMLPVALFDALVIVGLPMRLREAIVEVPSAYDAAPEAWAVADVFAGRLPVSIVQQSESAGDTYLWARNLSCLYQASHRRPILSRCISTDFVDHRSDVQDHVYEQVMAYADRMDTESISALSGWLMERGVGAVAVHADFLRPRDREQVLEGLQAALGRPAADTTDGGERVVLFVVPQVLDMGPPDREGVAAVWDAEQAPERDVPKPAADAGPQQSETLRAAPSGEPQGPPPGQIPERVDGP